MTGYPLENVRVVDLTQYVSGPYCTQVLADLGADIVKIERPGKGDVYRGQGPVFANGESASFLTLNRGKRSLELDFGTEDGRARLEELLAQADVLVENMRPGALAKHGLDYESLSELHPHLVYCSISAFGQTGPRAEEGGYDLTIQALSGLMAATGHEGQRPVKVPVAAIDFGSALYGVIGILAALAERERTGRGQWVQTSLLETALAWLSMHVVTYLLGGDEPAPTGTRSPFFAPYEAYRTGDGYLVVVGTRRKRRLGEPLSSPWARRARRRPSLHDERRSRSERRGSSCRARVGSLPGGQRALGRRPRNRRNRVRARPAALAGAGRRPDDCAGDGRHPGAPDRRARPYRPPTADALRRKDHCGEATPAPRSRRGARLRRSGLAHLQIGPVLAGIGHVPESALEADAGREEG